MEIRPNEYNPIPIPELTEGEPFWLLALGHLTRHNSKIFQLDTSKYDAYETWIRDNVKDKTVCVLGTGVGTLLHLADYYGAKKCIGLDSDNWICVYLKGLYPHMEIHNSNYYKVEWPEADIYLHNGCTQTFLQRAENLNKKVFPPFCNIPLVMKTREDLITDGVMDFSDTHARAYQELGRING